MTSDGTLSEQTLDRIRAVLRDYPVRLGVLFGSQATGSAGDHSDIDIAVEFMSSVEDPFQAQLELGVALTRILGTDDVDIVDLETIQPAVGYSALTNGRLLVGEQDQLDERIKLFDRAREQSTSAERRERFDDALGRLTELV